jgi:hypothetical protein
MSSARLVVTMHLRDKIVRLLQRQRHGSDGHELLSPGVAPGTIAGTPIPTFA